jgi:hypothetical protein
VLFAGSHGDNQARIVSDDGGDLSWSQFFESLRRVARCGRGKAHSESR